MFAVVILSACASKTNSAFKQYPLQEIGPVLGLASGPDGKMWFTQAQSKAIGSIDAAGNITMFGSPNNVDADPQRIAAGPDGALWFTQINPHAPVDAGPDMIGRITTRGVWAEFPIPSWDSIPQGIAAGPDGAMWFAERRANAIGRITMRGKITEFKLPHDGSGPTGIVRGPDGKMWFTETDGNRIGRIDPVTLMLAEFKIDRPGSKPGPIVAEPVGDVIFVELGNQQIERISTAGEIELNKKPMSQSAASPLATIDVAVASDGSWWLVGADGSIAWTGKNKLGHPEFRIVTKGDTSPSAIAKGPGNTIWLALKKGPSYSYTGRGAIAVIDASSGR